MVGFGGSGVGEGEEGGIGLRGEEWGFFGLDSRMTQCWSMVVASKRSGTRYRQVRISVVSKRIRPLPVQVYFARRRDFSNEWTC